LRSHAAAKPLQAYGPEPATGGDSRRRGWNDREMNVAALQAIRNAGATSSINSMTTEGCLRRNVGRKLASTVSICWVLQPTRSVAGLAGSQRARTLAERFGVLQETAAAPQQILAFGCQFDPAVRRDRTTEIPSSPSSAWIWREAAGWLRRSCCCAAAKRLLPATTTKVRSCRRSISMP